MFSPVHLKRLFLKEASVLPKPPASSFFKSFAVVLAGMLLDGMYNVVLLLVLPASEGRYVLKA